MITCRICNKEFMNLSSHINAKHNLTKQAYLALFPDAKIVSDELSKHFSKNASKTHKRLKKKDYEKYMETRNATCKKMRDNKGDDFIHSDETITKMKVSATTRPARKPHTKKTKKLLAEMKTGVPLNLTVESKEEKTKKQKARWADRREDTETFEKYLKNLSERRLEYLKEHGITLPKKGKMTSLEKRFIDFLTEHNIEYKFQHLLEGKNYDFFLPSLNLLVEVDGEYWHRMPQAIKNDIEKHIIAKTLDYKLLRITELKWNTELVFETDYSVIVEHNHSIINKRTTECQDYKISISMI